MSTLNVQRKVFSVRLPIELARQVRIRAAETGTKIEAFVEAAFNEALGDVTRSRRKLTPPVSRS